MCCLMLCSTPLCFHGSTAPVWCNSSWSRDPFARATLGPAGSPGWHAPARRRIEADSADNDSLHFDSILSGGLFGILEPVRRFAAHLPRGFHAASNLPRWLSQGSSVWGGSFRTFVLLLTYGVGAYSHHDEADDNLADGRTVKKTRGRCEQQRHQGRSTDSHLYRHRIGSGGQVT